MRGLRLVVFGALFIAACDSPIAPPPPPPAAPQISCSTPVTVDIVGLSEVVTYTAPVVTNGAAPVTVTCSPNSGGMFPLGETMVNCLAVDVMARQATCSFSVTVRHRELAISTVVAFGDSMTEGQNGQTINFVRVVDIPNAYPTILQEFFTTRIPSQQITVLNEGKGGERVTESEDRLKSVVASRRPQVLLFLDGANDMLAALPASTIANAIRDSIQTARERGVQYVFVSTVLPVAPQNCPPRPFNCRGATVPAGLPAATNQLIRPMVPANGAYLVDPYDEFAANSGTYVSIDGLHLNPEGNRALATAFWNRVVEVIPARQLTGMMSSFDR